MQSNYKSIGEYIRLVDERNVGLKITNLIGVSISKQFIKSVANIIGTDMENYKIIRKNQFACSIMQVRRDRRMPVALYKKDEPAMISQAYPVFEILDTNKLLPEYLMMWFTRSEFDREACFHAVGGVRGSLEWEDFCSMKLPIPSPEKQLEIVREYNVIQNRIKLNNQLIAKLEETAQAIYKQWFVDFEFPDKNGLPYKSNGGEMIDSELGEIPRDWKRENIGTYVKLSQGLVINAKTNHLIKSSGIPLLRITDLINDTQEIFIDELVPAKNIATEEDIIITRTGQVGLVFRNKKGVVYNNCFKIAPSSDVLRDDYLFWFLKKDSNKKAMIELASGSAQLDLTHGAFNTLPITIPKGNVQESFSFIIKPIERHKETLYNQNRKLFSINDLILAKMTKVEMKKELA